MGKWKQVQEYADHIPSPIEHYLENRNKATHILLVDALFTKVKGEDRAVMIAWDTGIGVVDYWIDCTENKTAIQLSISAAHRSGGLQTHLCCQRRTF